MGQIALRPRIYRYRPRGRCPDRYVLRGTGGFSCARGAGDCRVPVPPEVLVPEDAVAPWPEEVDAAGLSIFGDSGRISPIHPTIWHPGSVRVPKAEDPDTDQPL